MTRSLAAITLLAVSLIGLPARGAAPAAAADTPAAPAPAKPDPLVIFFPSGSAAIEPGSLPVLDHASRLYREGNPIVMIISGSTDRVGDPSGNLLLSQRRDQAVLRGLVARGIPVGRFQLLAKGETDPKVATAKGAAEAENRRVEITWR